jgi:hypothetical protein
LLAQCWPKEIDQVYPLAARGGAGVVVTTQDPTAAREAVQRRDRPMALLLDAARYAGAKRAEAAAPFRTQWLELQRSLDLPVLTDSGYCAADDYRGLDGLLERAATNQLCTIALLPLATWWLSEPDPLDFLCEQVAAANMPVAIALEHQKDPLGTRAAMAGLVRLITVGPPVIHLRADVSGLGAMCFGAWAAAVGTRSKLRHFYPSGAGGGPPLPPVVSTVVKECLTYLDVNKIAKAVQALPDSSLWRPCECPTCRYNTLDWMSMLSTREAQEAAAFSHALEMLWDLRDELIGSPSRPVPSRALSWDAACSEARSRFQELRSEHDRRGWPTPPHLSHWSSMPTPRSEESVDDPARDLT